MVFIHPWTINCIVLCVITMFARANTIMIMIFTESAHLQTMDCFVCMSFVTFFAALLTIDIDMIATSTKKAFFGTFFCSVWSVRVKYTLFAQLRTFVGLMSTIAT